MKNGIHPENYRLVVFKDMSNDEMFLCKSTAETKDAIEYEGETYTVSQLARKFGMKPQTLNKRLILKWSVEKSLNTPIK